MRRSIFVVGVGLGLGLTWFGSGCAPPADEAASEKLASQPDKMPDRQVALTVVDGAGLESVIAGHRGKIVLVDFWATWCAPCMAQFPHTVELGRRFGEQGLVVVSMSLDDPDDYDDVLEFLAEQGAGFDNLLSKYGVGSRTMEEFDLRGDIPLYRLYDRSGNLRYQFSSMPDGLQRGEPLANLDAIVAQVLRD